MPPQPFAASLWWNTTSAGVTLSDHRATIRAILFVLSFTDDEALLAELVDSVEDCTPWRKA